MKNLLVAQSGGPTAAINSTLVGILTYALTKKDVVSKVYGAINGIEGVLKEKIIDLTDASKDVKFMELLSNTPSSALGSCRYKINDGNNNDIEKIIKVFRKHNIGYFVYIGGNDSMDTVNKISMYCRKNGIEDIKIVGAPKTIDNDLVEIDHCPGFGSAAKYIATTFSEIECDTRVYNKASVTIVEVMGRDVGWLTASSALSRYINRRGPNLIYLCEREFETDKFIKDIRKELNKRTNVLVAISEGLKSKNGKYISEEIQSNTIDSFGHKYISGAGKILEEIVRKEIGCKVRSIELNLMQRCSGHILSKTDIEESKLLGMKACKCAIDGLTGVMSSLIRKGNNPYEIKLTSVPVDRIANKEKKVPLDWINEEGNYVKEEMIEYLYPLIQGEVKIEYFKGIPKHIVLC